MEMGFPALGTTMKTKRSCSDARLMGGHDGSCWNSRARMNCSMHGSAPSCREARFTGERCAIHLPRCKLGMLSATCTLGLARSPHLLQRAPVQQHHRHCICLHQHLFASSKCSNLGNEDVGMASLGLCLQVAPEGLALLALYYRGTNDLGGHNGTPRRCSLESSHAKAKAESPGRGCSASCSVPPIPTSRSSPRHWLQSPEGFEASKPFSHPSAWRTRFFLTPMSWEVADALKQESPSLILTLLTLDAFWWWDKLLIPALSFWQSAPAATSAPCRRHAFGVQRGVRHPLLQLSLDCTAAN